MKFNLIYRTLDRNNKKNIIPELFKTACTKQDVEFAGFDVCDRGRSFTLSGLPKLGKEDLLYRSAVDRTASTAERIMFNEHMTSFYTNWQSVNAIRTASWFTHVKHGLPVVPSFPGIPSSAEELDTVVKELGSFPIIIKVTGGSLGVGVMRIDSMKSLQSILDYLSARGVTVMLRKYIPHDYYVRAVVVGDKVVASHATYASEGEFRTNVHNQKKQKREVRVLRKDIQDVVVKAVLTLGLETGGVDMLFDNEGNPYIAEVNFPNDFSMTQKITGVDIAGEMLTYLVKKANI
jgi:ribosomal protein S6--L-glutamate ligase